MGGFGLKPKAWAPAIILSGPMVSVPIWAKAELHDTSQDGEQRAAARLAAEVADGLAVCGGV